MIDDIDRGQEAAEQFTVGALAAHTARVAASFEPRTSGVEGECIGCGEPIEPERLRVLRKTSRCAACAHRHEQQCRGQRGR